MPIDKGTLEFIQSTAYIFSSYINRDKIIRQFIKAQKSDYNALQATIIPLKRDIAFQNFYGNRISFLRAKGLRIFIRA